MKRILIAVTANLFMISTIALGQFVASANPAASMAQRGGRGGGSGPADGSGYKGQRPRDGSGQGNKSGKRNGTCDGTRQNAPARGGRR